MAMREIIRQEIRKYPRLREVLLPWWVWMLGLQWRVRKIIRWPVSYPAGISTVKLYPEGQIPEMLWKGDFEATERDFVATYLKPGMKVVNIGANVGLYTVMASALVKPGGEVHAFEPSGESHSRLINNIELNDCRNVIVKRVALSNTRGQLLLRVDPKNPAFDGHRFVESVNNTGNLLSSDELVEATTLDDYMAEQASRNIDLIIMDVEGAELSVLQGGGETLALTQPTILLECSKYQEDTEKLLKDLGYKFWLWNVIEQALVPVDFRKAAHLGDVVARREGWPHP